MWPKHHLTEHRLIECHLTESSFNRITIEPNAVLPKVHFTERSYDRFFFLQKMVIWSNILLTKNVIWPKKNFAQGRLTENSFDRKFIWPKAFFEKWLFDRKVIWLKGYFPEKSFDQKFIFWKIVIWQAPWKQKIGFILSLLLFQSCREYNQSYSL
jgi:hypothetical protein